MSNLWTRIELIVAFATYCQIPFGKIHHRNPLIQKIAKKLGRTPSALSMKMANLASLDPEIQKSGRAGLGNASRLDREIWDEFHNDWEKAFSKAEDYFYEGDFLDSEEKDFSADDVITEKMSRTRQGFFRKSVLSSYRNICCISQMNIEPFLVASHIVPWSVDKENRLNPKNGVCLNVLYDRAFDRGYITITTDFYVEVSKKIKESSDSEFTHRNLVSIQGQEVILPEKFKPDKAFLQYHNEKIFKG